MASAGSPFIAQDAHATSEDGKIIMTFEPATLNEPGENVTVQIPTTIADRLLVSLGAALAKSHATDAAEMVRRFTTGLTSRRCAREGRQPTDRQRSGVFWDDPGEKG